MTIDSGSMDKHPELRWDEFAKQQNDQAATATPLDGSHEALESRPYEGDPITEAPKYTQGTPLQDIASALRPGIGNLSPQDIHKVPEKIAPSEKTDILIPPQPAQENQRRVPLWVKLTAVVGAVAAAGVTYAAVSGGENGPAKAKASTSAGVVPGSQSKTSAQTTPNSSPSSTEKRPPTQDLHVPAAEVYAVAQKYHLTQKSISYSDYPEGVRKYAHALDYPRYYYDLTSLTQPLTMADYKALVPVLTANALLANNTNNVHYLDTGSTSLFGNDINLTPPKLLVSPELGRDWKGKTSYESFETQGSVYVGAYTGYFSQYDNSSVIHVDINSIPVKMQGTAGMNSGYIDTDNPFPSINEDGPTLTVHMEFDPQTNALITHTEQLNLP